VLPVLGDGKQRKSYLYVQDCVDGILLAIERATAKVNIFNLGLDEYCEVRDSIAWICEELNVQPELKFSGGERGWIGDNPFIFLDCSAIRALGWQPKLNIRQGVERTLRYLREHPELLAG
jgi:UDP-glucose 4-epimerase